MDNRQQDTYSKYGAVERKPGVATPESYSKYGAVVRQPEPQQEAQESPIESMPFLAKSILKLAPGAIQGATNPVAAITERAQGLVRGFKDVGQGAKQAMLESRELHGTSAPGTALDYTRKKDKERLAYEQSPAGRNQYANMIREGAASTPYAALGPVLGAEAGIGAKVGMGSVANAGAGGMQYVPEGGSRVHNALLSALLGGGGAFIPEFAMGKGSMLPGINQLTPSNLMARFAKSPLSEQELLRNLEVTKGTQTGLGDVIGSPTMKRLQENVFSKIPMTGANASLQQTGGEILNRGNKLLEGYRNNVPHGEVTNKLGSALKDAAKEQTKNKIDLYSEFNQEAEKSGHHMELPRFTKLARQFSDELGSHDLLKFEPDVRNLLSRLSNYKNPVKTETVTGKIVDKSGNPLINETKTTAPSLKEANLLAGRLNELSSKYGASISQGDRNVAGVLGNLGKALKQDVHASVNQSGNPKLISSFGRAEENYKKNFSTFLDKDIYKYTQGGEHPEDLLTTFLKSSNTADRAHQLNKLMSKLSPKQQDLARYGYFSRALEGAEDMRSVNPNKLKSLWTNLGENQKKVLVPAKSQRRQLDNYVMLVGKNQKSVNMMMNPATGQQNMDLVSALMLAHPLTSLKEIGGARLGNKLMTSEPTREKVVNAILKRRK